MRTATSNLIVLTVETVDDKILGTAIDGDIRVMFATENTELNQRLFLPEANLVVSGKIRLGQEICTIGIWITSVIAIVSLPNPVTPEIEAPDEIEVVAAVEAPADVGAPVTATKQKRASSRGSKKAKAADEAEP